MGKKIIDLTGTRIDNGKVIREVGRDKQRGVLWECQCSLCGEIFIEGSYRLNAVHNETHRRHNHKCSSKIDKKLSTNAAKALLEPMAANTDPFRHRSPDAQKRFEIARQWRMKNMTVERLGYLEACRYARVCAGVYPE